MKKLCIVMPTVGREQKEIIKEYKKLHSIAEVIFEEKFEIIGTVKVRELKERTPDDYARYMGYLKEADYVVTCGPWMREDRLTVTIRNICEQCGIPYKDIPIDLVNKELNVYGECF